MHKTLDNLRSNIVREKYDFKETLKEVFNNFEKVAI